MGVDKKGVRYCDECGRSIDKAHKIHLSNEYCGSCYARVFTAVPCSCCGGNAHSHRNDPKPALCSRCMIAERKCIRCEKSVPRAALLVEGKPVCPSCVPYFRDQGTCPHCNRKTSRLSSVPSAGITEKICEPCRNRLTHATCGACGKYRKVAQQSAKGPMCSGCVDDPSIVHACPDCGDAVSGGGNSRCRSCANKVALDRELNLTAAIFVHEWSATLWRRFGAWLHVRQSSKPNLIGLLRSHQIYFERIDATFSSVLDLTEASLLRLFGTATLRAHLLPTRFLAEQLDIQVSAEAKLDAAERARIDELLQASKREPWGAYVQSYLAELDRDGLSLRSIRMYLSTANQFASYAGLTQRPWTTGQIERFVAARPGTRNNLSRFVSFCRQSQGWDVVMPRKGSTSIAPIKHPAQSVSKLAKLIKKIDASGMDQADRKMLREVLATALGIPVSAIEELSSAHFRLTTEGISLMLDHEVISLPQELVPYGQRLLEYIQ